MVEWCKSRARAMRWVEEVRLVAEEMRRAIAFSESMAVVWDGRRDGRREAAMAASTARWASDKGWVEGVRAYACKQAWIRRAQASKWIAQLLVPRLQAETFLNSHTEDGICMESVEDLAESVQAITLQPAHVQ